MTDHDITIFIPCLNEEENVRGAMEIVFAAADKIPLRCEIVVFDDASSDGTSDIVRSFQNDHPERAILLIRNQVCRGVANNFIDGAFAGTGTYYRMVCGDNIEPLETHEAIFRSIGEADIVVPSYTEIRNRPLHRTVISKLFTCLVNLVSGHRLKYYNGGPVFRRADVLRYHVETSGFGFQAEFLTRLLSLGRTYKEVPLIAYDREGSTAITLKNLVSVGHSLLNIGLRRLRIVIFEP